MGQSTWQQASLLGCQAATGDQSVARPALQRGSPCHGGGGWHNAPLQQWKLVDVVEPGCEL
jgi:hypothetical protein